MNKREYEILATFWDAIASKDKYNEWKKIVRNAIQKYHIPGNDCLDLCCGTGNMIQNLLDLGLEPVGTDKSKEMLAIARKKFPSLTFYQQDIKKLNIGKNELFDLATCFYDSLNYLTTKKDILAAFRSINNTLKPGALFIFDMNTLGHVSAAQKMPPYVFENRKTFSIFRYGGNGKIWTLQMDFFIKQQDGSFSHFKEKHVEKGYDSKDIMPLLGKAGFDILDIHTEKRTNKDGKEYSNRSCFIARKRNCLS